MVIDAAFSQAEKVSCPLLQWPFVPSFGFATIGFGEKPDARFIAELFTNNIAGAVRRTVINDDDFKAWIAGCQQAVNRLCNNLFFVVSGDDY